MTRNTLGLVLLATALVGCGENPPVESPSSDGEPAVAATDAKPADQPAAEPTESTRDTPPAWAQLDVELAPAEAEPVEPKAPAATSGKSARMEGFMAPLLTDAPDGVSFFSFELGRAVVNKELTAIATGRDGREVERKIKADEKLQAQVRQAYDLMYDGSHGLIANAKVRGWEFGFGDGGIIGMGEVALADVKAAPAEGYKPHLGLDQLKPGCSFVVRTGTGKFAKFHVVEFSKEKSELVFDWYMQADGAAEFSE